MLLGVSVRPTSGAFARAAFERALAVREALTVPPDQLACTRYYLARLEGG